MNKIVAVLFAAFALISFDSFSQEDSTVTEINWMTFEEALAASEEEPKMWFIDMYTDWCGWCKRMDASTFKDPLIVQAINDNYYPVKFDAERKDDVIVGDSVYSFDATIGRRGCHQLAVQLLSGKMSYPSYVFLNAKKEVLTVVPGYKVSRDMLPILVFLVQYDPVTNPTDYQTFMKTYESPYDMVGETGEEQK